MRTRVPGAPDPEYVKAREVLLDALEALEAHLDSLILIGAQAVYLHAGEADLAVAPYTTDADLAIDVDALAPEPRLEQAMRSAGFESGRQPGAWLGRDGVQIDLMVAEVQSGARSRRAARIPPHGLGVARRTHGLEGALVDRERRIISGLDRLEARRFEIFIAGPAALLVAKLIKIAERESNPRRLRDKDALDVFRLLRAIQVNRLVECWTSLLADPRSRAVANAASEALRNLFATPEAPGCQMVIRATEGLEEPDEMAGACAILANDLAMALSRAPNSEGPAPLQER